MILDNKHDIELKQAPKRIFNKVNKAINSTYKYERLKQIKRIKQFYKGQWSAQVKAKIDALCFIVEEQNPLS